MSEDKAGSLFFKDPSPPLQTAFKLIGANLSFVHDFQRHNEDGDEKAHPPAKKNKGHSDGTEIVNQILKPQASDPLTSQHKSKLAKFSLGKTILVWGSKTLVHDMNLLLTTEQLYSNMLQCFILCEEQPPILVIFCTESGQLPEVKKYNTQIANKLHSRLLDFCYSEFTILSVTIYEKDDFTDDELTLSVKESLSDVKKYDQGPLLLNTQMMEELRQAATALSGSTFVYGLFNTPSLGSKFQVLIMNSAWRERLYSAIETLAKSGTLKVDFAACGYPALITALEAALRFSAACKVHVICSESSEIRTLFKKLGLEYKENLQTKINLNFKHAKTTDTQITVEVQKKKKVSPEALISVEVQKKQKVSSKDKMETVPTQIEPSLKLNTQEAEDKSKAKLADKLAAPESDKSHLSMETTDKEVNNIKLSLRSQQEIPSPPHSPRGHERTLSPKNQKHPSSQRALKRANQPKGCSPSSKRPRIISLRAVSVR